jgi:hypothetical protein
MPNGGKPDIIVIKDDFRKPGDIEVSLIDSDEETTDVKNEQQGDGGAPAAPQPAPRRVKVAQAAPQPAPRQAKVAQAAPQPAPQSAEVEQQGGGGEPAAPPPAPRRVKRTAMMRQGPLMRDGRFCSSTAPPPETQSQRTGPRRC